MLDELHNRNNNIFMHFRTNRTFVASRHFRRQFQTIPYYSLLYDVAINQKKASILKNRMTICLILFWRVHVTCIGNDCVNNPFLIEMMFILKAINFVLKGSFDERNLAASVVISYEIYETRQRLVS